MASYTLLGISIFKQKGGKMKYKLQIEKLKQLKMDGKLAMANQFENNGNSPICDVCESNVKEVYLCERCERSYCDKCSVPFTATNNIDFNFCKSCAGQDCYEDYE